MRDFRCIDVAFVVDGDKYISVEIAINETYASLFKRAGFEVDKQKFVPAFGCEDGFRVFVEWDDEVVIDQYVFLVPKLDIESLKEGRHVKLQE